MKCFYVRRHTGADDSFEWFVLNGHMRRRASKFFPTRVAAAAEREKLQARLDLAKAKVLRANAGRLRSGWRRDGAPCAFLDVCGNERISPALRDVPQARPLSPLSVSLGLGTPPSGPPPWRGSACCADASSTGFDEEFIGLAQLNFCAFFLKQAPFPRPQARIHRRFRKGETELRPQWLAVELKSIGTQRRRHLTE